MKFRKIIAVIALMLTSLMLLCSCSAVMEIPEVKKARFNFSITYEIEGVQTTYSGVYVCEFDGIYVSLVGSGREWSGYVENGYDEIPILTNDDGIIYIWLGFYPEYFMSDPSYFDSSEPFPTMYIVYHSDDPDNVRIENDSDIDFMEKYGVRIVNYEHDEPIENEFEEKFSFGRFDFSIN